MDTKISEIFNAIVDGDASAAKQTVQSALEAGIDAEIILNEGLVASMKEVGRLFEEGEYFVPEMLISARAMQAGMNILRPVLIEQDIKPSGKVVIGTVRGDLHDIGKNLVSMMLEGAGFQIVDLGTDVAPEKFLEAVTEHKPDILGMSALLTTTMSNIKATIQYFEEKGVRKDVKIIIGGAPITQSYADEIGADGFAPDASQAAALAKRLMGKA
ncbi:MAG: corrinoid protein [Anaerolineaceae bacterium]|nr:corrinoid protein [Anaerolineaceae bacterium]